MHQILPDTERTTATKTEGSGDNTVVIEAVTDSTQLHPSEFTKAVTNRHGFLLQLLSTVINSCLTCAHFTLDSGKEVKVIFYRHLFSYTCKYCVISTRYILVIE